MTRLQKRFIEASSGITDFDMRSRAELTTYLVLMKILMDLSFVPLSLDAHHFPLVMVSISFDVTCYFIARSVRFQWAAFAVCLYTVGSAFFAQLMAIHDGQPDPNITIWMGIGSLISALTLPIRHTVVVVGIICLAFVVVSTQIPAQHESELFIEFLFTIVISGFGLIAATQRDRSNLKLKNEQAKVLQSSKLASLGEMASGVAHELNSPLGAIVLNAEMAKDLIEESENDAATEALVGIVDIAERMSEIIGGLKSFARDSHLEERQPIEVKTWLNDSLNLCQQRFKSNGIRLEIAPENLHVVCSVRRIQLSQVLLNLLNNAFDAISANAEKWVRVEARLDDGALFLSVIDSGKGVSPEAVSRLFEPFFTTKDYGQGTGLGLSIAKGIVQSHGGDLFYDETSPNTRFTLRIPVLTQVQPGVAA